VKNPGLQERMNGVGLGPYEPTAAGLCQLHAEATRWTWADTLAIADVLVADGDMEPAEREKLAAEGCR
jgi:hypothetical protein